MSRYVNAALYRFTPLEELKSLRERLKLVCRTGEIKGTILLSREGINLFVAGVESPVRRLFDELARVPGLENLEPKLSYSEEQPFTRMLVKIKKEIIAFGIDSVDPVRDPAPKLAPRELKAWLDDGRPITLLDTRNDYEVELGTFQHAVPIGISHFRDFPQAVERLPTELKHQPIVMFCTGGIRCEKAGPYMRQVGFEQIYQLDGGILKYFEECGQAHYQGECFVFDKRVGLDPSLEASGKTLCYVCQRPLNKQQQLHPHYVEGRSCEFCYRSSVDDQRNQLFQHQLAIQEMTSPLPGSIPYENIRPLNVPRAFNGSTVLDLLCGLFARISRTEWQHQCDQGNILDSNHQAVHAPWVVREGERYYHRQPLASEPPVNPAIRIVHEDEALIVIDKPAPLPVHPCGRFNKNSLQSILRQVYAPQKPRPAHRLDANTTGIIVFTRTVHFAKFVQPQFERGLVRKRYLARVQGHPPDDAFACHAPIREQAGEVGSRGVDPQHGLSAHTEFRVYCRLPDGTAILQVQPLTGRTNQIRVHLWHLGWPILGDQTYLQAHQLGSVQTQTLDDPPLCLHAAELTFTHPLTNQQVSYEAPHPDWAIVPEHHRNPD